MLRRLLSYKTPHNILLVLNLFALLLVYVLSGDYGNTYFALGIVFVFFLYLSNFILQKISSGDHYIFLVASALMSIGLIMIYRLNHNLGVKQVTWVVLGVILYFIVYFTLKYIRGWEKWTLLYPVISSILFIATLIFGTRVKGAINWIKVGTFSFQPAEIIKILFIFFLASYYSNKEKRKEKKDMYILMGVVYSSLMFLFIQRDLGMALIFYLTFLIILYIYEENRKLILYNILAAVFGGFVSFLLLNHVRVRVETWINPWQFIDTKGYQIAQSLFAIASGGFFGTGIGLGHPEYIPEAHNDFIFSAICEEMGIFTGMAVILLFLILVYRGFKIALSQSSTFFRIIAIGISSMLGFQAFIIVGGVMKMIPLTGITLPFISYGGSSLISSFIALGILQICSEEIEWEQEENYEQGIQEDN